MSTLSDGALLERVAGGDADAFTVLYRRYERPIFGMLLRLAGGRRALAEEWLQEAFTRVWLAAGTHDPSRGEVRPWLYKIALNTARSEMARKRFRTPHVSLDEAGLDLPGEGAERDASTGWTKRGRRASSRGPSRTLPALHARGRRAPLQPEPVLRRDRRGHRGAPGDAQVAVPPRRDGAARGARSGAREGADEAPGPRRAPRAPLRRAGRAPSATRSTRTSAAAPPAAPSSPTWSGPSGRWPRGRRTPRPRTASSAFSPASRRCGPPGSGGAHWLRAAAAERGRAPRRLPGRPPGRDRRRPRVLRRGLDRDALARARAHPRVATEVLMSTKKKLITRMALWTGGDPRGRAPRGRGRPRPPARRPRALRGRAEAPAEQVLVERLAQVPRGAGQADRRSCRWTRRSSGRSSRATSRSRRAGPCTSGPWGRAASSSSACRRSRSAG